MKNLGTSITNLQDYERGRESMRQEIVRMVEGMRGYEVEQIEDGRKAYEQHPACGGHHDVKGGHISDFEEELCDECRAINKTLNDIKEKLNK